MLHAGLVHSCIKVYQSTEQAMTAVARVAAAAGKAARCPLNFPAASEAVAAACPPSAALPLHPPRRQLHSRECCVCSGRHCRQGS